jgi:hypothetical protein
METHMSANTEVATILHLFDDKFGEIEQLLDGLEPAALLWKPFDSSPGNGEAAELGWLVGHSISATVYLVRRAVWICERLEWESVVGDKGAELFGPEDRDPGALLARSRSAQALVHELLTGFSPEDLERSRALPHRADRTRNAREDILHALEHMSQHIGHAQLTRQLWALPAD